MKRLVLVGGGHAHLHVLKTLTAGTWPAAELVLVSPHARQVYSGMVPGWIAGHYRLDECAAALEPLARAAGVRFVQDSVIGLDAERRVLHCAAGGEIAYDLLSLDIGAQVDCSSLAATGAALLPIRPLERFIVEWDRQSAAFIAAGRARVAVVGGGAAGVELALAIRHRLVSLLGADRTEVFLVEGGALLKGHGERVVSRVAAALAAGGVERLAGYAAGSATGLLLSDGRDLAVHCVVAATGVVPAPWLAESGLALAGDGFIAVGEGQQSTSHPEVFAAGDVATRVAAPQAKSGVHAVRAGPVLAVNLRRALEGRPPAPDRPRLTNNLYLLATGPQQAVVSWGGWSATGRWAWRWKDWIDRRFMKQYALGEGEGT
ncbi:MAG TPA: FAD-dependent oxidoreductase [Rhodocyclaceae bacterium]|nr:FAD-dependent oxidoreductase [Rhodocyclaceae bacterium]